MALYREIYDGPARVYLRAGKSPAKSRKRYITIHCTQNTAPAANEASYAKRRTDASSHYYVDDARIVQSLPTDWQAGHVGSRQGNVYGISYEITGLIQWSRSRWLSSVAWDLLATQIRRDCAEHGITPRLLTVAQIREGKLSGIITHNQARLAWGGTDHTDPGPNFPMDHLLSLVAGKREDEMSWSERIRRRPWVSERWPHLGESAEAGDTLAAVYGFARMGAETLTEGVPRLVDGQAELLAGQAAILAKLDGADDGATRQAIRDELERHRAALLAEVREDLDELAELVRRRDTGELTAEQVVDEIARRLSGGNDDD